MSVDQFVELDSPALVMRKLAEVEADLAERQNSFETSTGNWYTAQREIKRAHAIALLSSDEKSVTEKKAHADIAATACEGSLYEAEYEALKAVIRVLEQRSMILMALLKSQGRF
jgi:hypothetical protein